MIENLRLGLQWYWDGLHPARVAAIFTSKLSDVYTSMNAHGGILVASGVIDGKLRAGLGSPVSRLVSKTYEPFFTIPEGQEDIQS